MTIRSGLSNVTAMPRTLSSRALASTIAFASGGLVARVGVEFREALDHQQISGFELSLGRRTRVADQRR